MVYNGVPSFTALQTAHLFSDRPLHGYDHIFIHTHTVGVATTHSKAMLHPELSDADKEFQLPNKLSVRSVSSPNGRLFLRLIMHVIKDGEQKD